MQNLSNYILTKHREVFLYKLKKKCKAEKTSVDVSKSMDIL